METAVTVSAFLALMLGIHLFVRSAKVKRKSNEKKRMELSRFIQKG